MIRVAAVGDIHFGPDSAGTLRPRPLVVLRRREPQQGGAGDTPGSRGDPVARRSRRFPPHHPHPAAQLGGHARQPTAGQKPAARANGWR